jgi:hypothetical protein
METTASASLTLGWGEAEDDRELINGGEGAGTREALKTLRSSTRRPET